MSIESGTIAAKIVGINQTKAGLSSVLQNWGEEVPQTFGAYPDAFDGIFTNLDDKIDSVRDSLSDYLPLSGGNLSGRIFLDKEGSALDPFVLSSELSDYATNVDLNLLEGRVAVAEGNIGEVSTDLSTTQMQMALFDSEFCLDDKTVIRWSDNTYDVFDPTINGSITFDTLSSTMPSNPSLGVGVYTFSIGENCWQINILPDYVTVQEAYNTTGSTATAGTLKDNDSLYEYMSIFDRTQRIVVPDTTSYFSFCLNNNEYIKKIKLPPACWQIGLFGFKGWNALEEISWEQAGGHIQFGSHAIDGLSNLLLLDFSNTDSVYFTRLSYKVANRLRTMEVPPTAENVNPNLKIVLKDSFYEHAISASNFVNWRPYLVKASDYFGIVHFYELNETLTGYATNDSLSSYATKNDLNEYATQEDLENYATVESLADYAQKSELATVATTGSYNDLEDTPTIPTVGNGTLTIKTNGTTLTSFNANASTNATADIEIPTNTSDLENDSGYITQNALNEYALIGTRSDLSTVNSIYGTKRFAIVKDEELSAALQAQIDGKVNPSDLNAYLPLSGGTISSDTFKWLMSNGYSNMLSVDPVGGNYALGNASEAGPYLALAIGTNAHAAGGAVAIGGLNAWANGDNSIQIGQGTNNTAGTTQIKDWQLLDANGNIPEARLSSVGFAKVGTASDLSSANTIYGSKKYTDDRIGNIDSILDFINGETI